MIFFTGDTHGNALPALVKTRKSEEEDFLIVVGDFGHLWDKDSYKTIKYLTRWINENRPNLKLLFVAGNHENFNMIEELEEINMFGGTVGLVSERIFHLKTGQKYEIQNQKFVVFGGALSIDKHERKENKTWWSQEIPSYQEMQDFATLLDTIDTKEYILLTHTTSDLEILYFDKFPFTDKLLDPVANYLKFIKKQYEFKYQFFGHFHMNMNIPEIKSYCLYKDVVELNESLEEEK